MSAMNPGKLATRLACSSAMLLELSITNSRSTMAQRGSSPASLPASATDPPPLESPVSLASLVVPSGAGESARPIGAGAFASSHPAASANATTAGSERSLANAWRIDRQRPHRSRGPRPERPNPGTATDRPQLRFGPPARAKLGARSAGWPQNHVRDHAPSLTRTDPSSTSFARCARADRRASAHSACGVSL